MCYVMMVGIIGKLSNVKVISLLYCKNQFSGIFTENETVGKRTVIAYLYKN